MTTPEAPKYDPEELYGIVNVDPRRPYDVHEVIARIVDGSRFDEFKQRYAHDARHRLRAAARLPRRHHRQQRRAVLRVGAQGDALHRAVQPARHSARVPAEHHRVHGRPAVRARRHREGRRQDGARGRQLASCRSSPSSSAGRSAPATTACAAAPTSRGCCGCGRTRESPSWAASRRRPCWRPSSATSSRARGARFRPRRKPAIRTPILEKYDREGSPYYSTARLWDDGVLDPAKTREALALGLSAAYNAPIPEPKFGVFRM